MRRPAYFVLLLFCLPAVSVSNETNIRAQADRHGFTGCQFSDQSGSETEVLASTDRHATAVRDDEKVGCCCLLKDSGPPPVWDCTGYKDGTLVTRAQCKKDADDVGAKFKWHEGKCSDKD
jgi:hypothetical protein